jgi:hypothetical protein
MHEFHRIVGVTVIPPFGLRLEFEDGIIRIVDLEPVLYGGMHGPLRDPAVFAQVRLDSDWHTVVWPNDADFQPDTLYNWDQVKDDYVAAARQYTAAKA